MKCSIICTLLRHLHGDDTFHLHLIVGDIIAFHDGILEAPHELWCGCEGHIVSDAQRIILDLV
jgi:hypothetical protein